MKKVYLYKGFERFWHWTQTLLIFFLMLTGFEIHGTYQLPGYKNAVRWHDNAGWAFLASFTCNSIIHCRDLNWTA